MGDNPHALFLDQPLVYNAQVNKKGQRETNQVQGKVFSEMEIFKFREICNS
jgi:hypothetical protein